MRTGLIVLLGLTCGCATDDAAPVEGDTEAQTESGMDASMSGTMSSTAGTTGTGTGSTGTGGSTFATMTATDSTSSTTSRTTDPTGEESSSGESSGGAADCETLGLEGLLLYSTLDDAGSVTTPMVGNGPGEVNTTPADDFVAGVFDDAIQLDDATEYVRFPQVGNIDFQQGTLEFCLQPSYDHLDSLDHSIFDTGDLGTGGMRIRKAGGDNGNNFQVFANPPGGGNLQEFNGPSNGYALVPGQWHRVTVSWDFTVAAGVPSIRAWIDGNELLDASGPTGPITTISPDPSGYVWIGAMSSGNWAADGVIDDVRIYDSALVP